MRKRFGPIETSRRLHSSLPLISPAVGAIGPPEIAQPHQRLEALTSSPCWQEPQRRQYDRGALLTSQISQPNFQTDYISNGKRIVLTSLRNRIRISNSPAGGDRCASGTDPADERSREVRGFKGDRNIASRTVPRRRKRYHYDAMLLDWRFEQPSGEAR